MTTANRVMLRLLLFGLLAAIISVWWAKEPKIPPGAHEIKVRMETNAPGTVAVTWVIGGTSEGDDIPQVKVFERRGWASPGQFVLISGKPSSKSAYTVRTVVIIFQDGTEVKRDASEGAGIAVAEWEVT